MSAYIPAERRSIESYATAEPVLLDVSAGRLTLVLDDGERLTFDAQQLIGEAEKQLLADQREERHT